MAVKYVLLFFAFVAAANAQALTEVQQIELLHQNGFDGACLDCNSLRCLQLLLQCPYYAQRVQFQGACEALNRLPPIVIQRQCVYQNQVREHGQVLRVGNVQCLCSNSEWQCTQLSVNTVVKTLENDPKTITFSFLMTLPEYSDIKDVLEDVDAAMTVFVPNDDAWTQFIADTGLDLVLDADVIKAALLYHVATSGGYSARILSAAQGIVMSDGETATITREVLVGALGQYYYGALTIDESKVVTADIIASNALIHIIDKVMVSAAPPVGLSLFDELLVLPGHEVFATIINLVGYEGTKAYLSDPTIAATVFVPGNQQLLLALQALNLDPANQLDAPAIDRILQYHIVTTGAILAGDIPQGDTVVNTLAGVDLVVGRLGNNVVLNAVSQVLVVDILATNGVIHEISEVLNPGAISGSLASELPLVPAHNLFGQVLDLPGFEVFRNYLDTTLAATVFLPNNNDLTAALAAAGLVATNPLDVPAILNIMSGHVVPAGLDSANVPQGSTQVTTLAATVLTVNRLGNAITLTTTGGTTAQVVVPDIAALNGWIHGISAVLL